eukprot:6662271-Pyramimonas_sp.AAC.1
MGTHGNLSLSFTLRFPMPPSEPHRNMNPRLRKQIQICVSLNYTTLSHGCMRCTLLDTFTCWSGAFPVVSERRSGSLRRRKRGASTLFQRIEGTQQLGADAGRDGLNASAE